MERKFYVRAGAEIVEVTEEVYREYYRHRRYEKTLAEKDARNRLLHYDEWDAAGSPGVGVIADAAPSPEEIIISGDECERLRLAMLSLNEEERGIIRALFYLEKSVTRLAAELNVPRRTLGYRVEKILLKLRGAMGE